MEYGEELPVSPAEVVQQFGAELASGGWTADEAATQLAVTLTALRCEASCLAEDLTLFMEQAGDQLIEPHNPLFNELVRLATVGIIFREDRNREPQLDQKPEIPDDLSLETLIANSTEGVTWIDPDAERRRSSMTTETAELLMSLFDGLQHAGFPKAKARGIARAVLDNMLDDLATSTSYSAMYLTPILMTVMFKAHLFNITSGINFAKRLGRAFKRA